MTDFKYFYGLRMKAYPSDQQKHTINKNINAARFIYNEMVAIDRDLYKAKQVKGITISLVERDIEYLTKLKKRISEIVNIHTWLQDPMIDSLALNYAKRHYQASWKNYREQHKNGTPNFKKKGYSGSYQTVPMYGKQTEVTVFKGNIRFIDLKHIKLPKIGIIRVSGTQKNLFKRKSDIRLGTITVSRDNCGDYYISAQLASDTPFVKIPNKTNKSVGVDLNLENFLTESNSSMVENPRFYQHAQTRIRHAARKMSKRQKRAENEHRKLSNSKNYLKQHEIYAKRCRKVRNQRNNHIHNVTKNLIENYDFIAAENLLSKNMMKNRRLALKISDVGWGIFLTTMNYKAILYNKKFVMVDPRNTTQTCSNCGTIMGHNGYGKLTLRIREWTCPKCGYKHIRDANAAINILVRGLEMENKKNKLATNAVEVDDDTKPVLVGETGQTTGTLTTATITR